MYINYSCKGRFFKRQSSTYKKSIYGSEEKKSVVFKNIGEWVLQFLFKEKTEALKNFLISSDPWLKRR